MLGTVIFTKKIEQETYGLDGKRITMENFKAHKDKVFVVAVIGCMPLDDVTPELVKERLLDLGERVIIKKKPTIKKSAVKKLV